jgi:phage-related protein (TIGR01555 family)
MGEVVQFQADGLKSLLSGLGDPSRDKAASGFYAPNLLTDQQLINAYRSSWIARKLVDIPAQDALRKWRNWQADQKQIELIEAQEKRLGLQAKLQQCKTLARLWGGAAIFIGTDQEPHEPFNPKTLKKDGLRYLTVFSRRELAAGELEQDPFSEDYGKPAYYEVAGTNLARIHPSRLVLQIGAPHADPWNVQGPNSGWGDSVLQSSYDAVRNADGTAANIASLVFEANVDVFGVPDFMASLADPAYEKRVIDRFTLAAACKSINKSLVHDATETYDRKQISFAQLPEIMQQFLLMVSGASDIPMTRFLGQSPAGMSSTGEGDMKNYHDKVQSIQTLELQPAMYRLDEALIRSTFGDRPAEVWYDWAPLEQMSEKEISEIGERNAKMAETFTRTGIYTGEELRSAMTNLLTENGIFPGLDKIVSDTDAGNNFDLGEEDDDKVIDPVEPGNGTAGSEIQALALNGAQVRSLVELVYSVSAKEIPEETAVGIIQAAFPAVPTDVVAEIIKPLRGFEQPKTVQADAAPRTLYVSRKVKNADEIIAWAKSQGFKTTLAADDLHVTIAFSRTAIDWMQIGEPWDSEMTVAAGGPRLMEKFSGGAVVLQFKSRELEWRHEAIREAGASWDWPEYQPHITITYDPDGVDLATVEPYQGEIVLGPEIFVEVDDDWKSGVSEQ